MLPTLYHWTCRHAYDALGESGELLSGSHFISTIDYLTLPLVAMHATTAVWLTDIAMPSSIAREQLGLTSKVVDCDRMAYRYRAAQQDRIVPWSDMSRHWPAWVIRALESVEGVDPSRWWCSPGPVQVTYSPVPLAVTP